MSQVTRWGKLDGEELKIKFGCKSFVFINDFEACAYALADLKRDEIVQIRGEEPLDFKPKLVIGPGTGLGTATLIS